MLIRRVTMVLLERQRKVLLAIVVQQARGFFDAGVVAQQFARLALPLVVQPSARTAARRFMEVPLQSGEGDMTMLRQLIDAPGGLRRAFRPVRDPLQDTAHWLPFPF